MALIEVNELTSFKVLEDKGRLLFQIGVHKDDWNGERILVFPDKIAWELSEYIQKEFHKYFDSQTKTP